MSDSYAALLGRLEAVERENRALSGSHRLLKRVSGAVLAMFAVALYTGQAGGGAKVLEGEKLILKDAKGKARIELTAGETSSIRMLGANGKDLFKLYTSDPGSTGSPSECFFYDHEGKVRLALDADKAGSSTFSAYAWDKTEKLSGGLLLYVDPNGKQHIELEEKDNKRKQVKLD